MKRKLSPTQLKALKPAPTGKTYDVMDTLVPGFGVRVSDKGRQTFMLVARYGARNPTRRAIGVVGGISLEQARQKARDWLTLVRQGQDPQHVEERARQAVIRQQAITFGAVADDFIAEKLPGERKGKEVERDIRREFIPVWGNRPIADISGADVAMLIKAKKRTAPAQARNLLGIAKRLFGWAVDQHTYGLTASPAESLKPTKIIGEKVRRERVLNDAELFALMRAAGRMRYPHGPVYELLVRTGLRLNEVADAGWSEFDLAGRRWTIPAARMKGKNGRARAHEVPLTDDMLAILNALPRVKGGDCLFSTTAGARSVWMSDKVKKRLDGRMLRTLRALAKQRGDDPAKVKMESWRNHDIRHTVRSGLSRLKISEEAREAVLAHARPGIKGTYDHHTYFEEKREALELWGARLRAITREFVDRTPNNIVALRKPMQS